MTIPDKDIRDPALSQLYRSTPAGEPPAALDAAILAAARAATAPEKRPRPWWQRLRLPVTVAATVVLAVMLSLTMERHPPGSEEAVPASAPQQSAPASPPPAALPEPKAVPSVADKAARAKSVARDAYKEENAAPAAPAKPVPPPAPALPSPPSAAEASSAAPAAAKARSLSEDAGGAARERREYRQADVAPAPAAAAAIGSASRSAPARLAPDAWLEEIRQLRSQGRLPEADQRLREFRAAFPDYPLPEDLR